MKNMEDKIEICQLTCARVGCHCIFYLPLDMIKRLQNTHESFCCLFGHLQNYDAKTDLEIEREKNLELHKKIYELEDAKKPTRKWDKLKVIKCGNAPLAQKSTSDGSV